MESSPINLLLSQDNFLLSERLAGIRTELSELAESSPLAQVAFENLQHLLVTTQEDVDKSKQNLQEEEQRVCEKNKEDNDNIVTGCVVPVFSGTCPAMVTSSVPGTVIKGRVIGESEARIVAEPSVEAATGKGDIKGRFFKFVDVRRRDYKEENTLLRVKMMALSCQDAELRNSKSQWRVAMEQYAKEHKLRQELQEELDKLTQASGITVFGEEAIGHSSSSENHSSRCEVSNEDSLGTAGDSIHFQKIRSLTLLVGDYRTKANEYKKKYEDLEKELTSSKRMYQNIASNCASLSEAKEVAENKVMIMEDDLQHYKKENESLAKKVMILSDKFKKVQEADTAGKIEQSQRELLAVTRERENLKEAVEKERAQNEGLIKLVAKLQQEANEAKGSRVDAENRARVAEITLESLPNRITGSTGTVFRSASDQPLAMDRDGVLMVGDQEVSPMCNVTCDELSAEVDRLRRQVSKLLGANRLEKERMTTDFNRRVKECEETARNENKNLQIALQETKKELVRLRTEAVKEGLSYNSFATEGDTRKKGPACDSYQLGELPNGIASCYGQSSSGLQTTGSPESHRPDTALLRLSLGIFFSHWERLLDKKGEVIAEDKEREVVATNVTTASIEEASCDKELNDMRCELRKKEYLMEGLRAELRSMSLLLKEATDQNKLLLFLKKQDQCNEDVEKMKSPYHSNHGDIEFPECSPQADHSKHKCMDKRNSMRASGDTAISCTNNIMSLHTDDIGRIQALERQNRDLMGIIDENQRENLVLRQELKRQGTAMNFFIENRDDHAEGKGTGNVSPVSQFKSKLPWDSKKERNIENQKLTIQLKNLQYLLESKLTENMKLTSEIDELQKAHRRDQ